MKTAKRIVCFMLTLALMTGTVIIAAAEDVSDYLPIVTQYPTAIPERVYIGDSFAMKVKAEFPEGKTGTINYVWNRTQGGATVAVGEGDTLTVTVTEDMVSKVPVHAVYSVDVNFTYIDKKGVEHSSSTMGWYGTVWHGMVYSPLCS